MPEPTHSQNTLRPSEDSVEKLAQQGMGRQFKTTSKDQRQRLQLHIQVLTRDFRLLGRRNQQVRLQLHLHKDLRHNGLKSLAADMPLASLPEPDASHGCPVE